MSEALAGSQFIRFCAIGTAGFLVDSGVLLILAGQLSFAPLPARVGSFLVASTVTYVLNRRYTFRQRSAGSVRQWFLYVFTTGLGAAVNIGTYYAWVAILGATAATLVGGVALGSLIALFFNYSISRLLVFRART